MSVSPAATAATGLLAPRPIVGLLTDFGLVDDAVGICKGMVLSIAPHANIIDVTHDVTPFDIYEASLYIRDSFRYFPGDAVFACVTFPHTGVQDNAIGLRTPQGHTYFAPDNGLLTRIVKEAGVAEVRRITSEKVRRPVIDPTFYGRDIVISAAAHIANGISFSEIGDEIEVSDITLLDVAEPTVEDGWIVGEVAILDKNYGNVWTSITREFLDSQGVDFEAALEIEIGGARLSTPLRRTFGETGEGEPLAYIASRDQLGLALNQGNFAARYGVERGHTVRVKVR
ncbi:SAM-dependent chlorinase/fluorinase [Streptomyces sp. BE20]|uniref:SAM hydrolase/SAM-dependent halogenase family protein n=1 Tax=unclassified Streptomyces TaxID=2593676 RepID=UPI002E76A301|nr:MULTISPECIES: SAM-dependent chlorinase/fluorinase [unclassified Streptomyces]MED7948440.1 SAM-dependent chlorinase/fluorinase [Streptomyces sp. BE303]MEE1824676.1 SAM-dependent chlorinase/fluorinase [Streptomyces sp. BE20]